MTNVSSKIKSTFLHENVINLNISFQENMTFQKFV